VRLDLPPRADAVAAAAVLAAGVAFVVVVIGLAVTLAAADGPLVPLG
jgi:hypothetical protein